MASPFSTSGTLDRKSLRKPDTFTETFLRFFNDLSKQANLLVVSVIVLLGLGILGALYMNHLEARSESARNALYLADKALEKEIKVLVASESPKALKESAEKTAPGA